MFYTTPSWFKTAAFFSKIRKLWQKRDKFVTLDFPKNNIQQNLLIGKVI